MSNQFDHATPQSGTGRFGLWAALLASLALLGTVTASAIRHNPLQSHDPYMSQYRFIEECREALHQPDNLPIVMGMGQAQPLGEVLTQAKQLTPQNSLVLSSVAAPRDMVGGLQNPEQGQYQLTMPVMIALKDRSSGALRPLGPVQMQCSYDHKKSPKDRLNVILSVAG